MAHMTNHPERGLIFGGRAHLWALATGVLAAGVLGAGCGPDFEPYWRVDNLRVLAVKADPVVLEGGESAQLQALAHHGAGAPVSYAWEWCPFRVSAENHYECPMTVDALNALLGEQAEQDGQPGFELPEDFFEIGEGESVDFSYPGSPEMIRGFCDAIVSAIAQAGERSPLGSQLPTMDCERGFEISLRLKVSADDEEIVTRKRLLLSTGPKTQINLNPDLSGLQISLADRADEGRVRELLPWVSQPPVDSNNSANSNNAADSNHSDDSNNSNNSTSSYGAWHHIPADSALPIVAGVTFKVRAVVDPESVEMWTPPAPEGADEEYLEPRLEALTFRWFTSAGILDKPTSLYVDGQNTLLEASETEFKVKFDANAPGDSDRNEGVTSSLRRCEPGAITANSNNTNSGDANSDDESPDDTDIERDDCDIYLWSVVRDGRLGQAFIERRLRLIAD